MGGRSLTNFELFALESSRKFGERIAASLDRPLSEHEERSFEDGEHKCRPLVNVRNRDAFVVQVLFGDDQESANDKLCRLLFFAGALKDASARSVTAVVPYLCYARKDKKTKPRDPVTTRYVAQLFEAVGVDRVVTMDVHNLAAFQNAFRRPTDHLEARPLFVEHFVKSSADSPLTVVSPDVGGTKRAEALAESLRRRLGRDVATAFMEKHRSEGIVTGERIVGEVTGRVALIVDDLISTGTTLARAIRACRALDAVTVHAVATHACLAAGALERLVEAGAQRVVLTNTVTPKGGRITATNAVILDAAPLFAESIRRIQTGDSLSALFD